MAHWLLKTEASVYSFDALVRDGSTFWEGVRNYQARNNLRAMKKGDTAFIYHSVDEKRAVGAARVTREAYPDPTDKTGEWSVVEVVPVHKFAAPVTLAQFKSDTILKETALVRQSRLSVVPLTPVQAKRLIKLAAG
ncbi:MAG: EVE domain-containing protein [Candidatus Omnitrophica bacterium]|nr:EVE domain-containing protein [Candidatus Omnitrophota bacterium]